MEELVQIKKDIQEIKERNRRVEKDKAWETSLFRKVLVAVLTYATMVLFFFFAQVPNPLINAIVPTLGFLLSTLSISFIKRIWINRLKQ